MPDGVANQGDIKTVTTREKKQAARAFRRGKRQGIKGEQAKQVSQWHFDFVDWRDAFEMFYRHKARDKAFCLVVATDPEVSGYWIERDAVGRDDARVYRSVKAVKALEARVTAATR